MSGFDNPGLSQGSSGADPLQPLGHLMLRRVFMWTPAQSTPFVFFMNACVQLWIHMVLALLCKVEHKSWTRQESYTMILTTFRLDVKIVQLELRMKQPNSVAKLADLLQCVKNFFS